MRSFDEIFQIAADRKGGAEALTTEIDPLTDVADLRLVSDDRCLSGMTKSVFQAGFNWKVVEAMWPRFEAAFGSFDVGKCAMLNDDDFARLVSDKRIVRYGAKIRAVQENAQFSISLIRQYGSVAMAIAQWPQEDYVGLLELLKKQGSRLGGKTGQYFLRRLGKDGYILSNDVVGRLIAESIVEKPPTSKKALAQVQNAFNTWHLQSGRSFKEISQVLAKSVG